MDHGQLRMVADKFQWVFSEPLLNACGTKEKFCRRQRLITPCRLGLALTAICAKQRIETLADFPRGFKAFWGTTITYKAFYHQVAKPRFADGARTMTSRLIGDMTLTGLGVPKGHACAEFRQIVLQDGSSCAIHDGVRAVFPGRFKVVKPAAVALHTTMDVLCDAPPTVVFTPETTREPSLLPAPQTLTGRLRLAERGSIDVHSMRRVQDEGGFLLMRAKAGRNPQVVEAFREDGTRRRSLRNTPLTAIHTQLPTRQRVAVGVGGQLEEGPRRRRLRLSWNPKTKSFCSFLTKLPPKRSALEVSCRAYKWRGHVELLCKAWQSYAHLHAFDTANPAMVAGLMWMAIAAAALKRFLASRTPRLAEVPMSTRKVAMCAVHVLGDIVRALQSGDVAGLYAALEAAITSLARHAQRAHPKRDRQTGRAQLGLEPCFEHDDVIEFAEAA
jgi:ribosome-associated translation inhibitor RaiA